MKKPSLILFIALSLAVCSVSAITLAFGYKAENRENRPLARFPAFIGDGEVNLAFPTEFDRYFEDHFGLREEMVTAFHALTIGTLGDTLNEKVIVGKNGTLFFEETLNDYLGINLLSDADIARAAASIRLQSEYAEALGASFTFALAPNKNTIYPELMPGYLLPTNLPSNRGRLYEALQEAGVETLDFSALLRVRKGEGILYHPRDTHWNDRGVIIAYERIMSRVAPNVERSYYFALEPAIQYDYAGDLHNFVLPAVIGTNPRPVYPVEAEYELDARARPAQDASFGTRSDVNSAKLYLFRDSFSDALIPYLSANLGRVVYSREFPYNYTPVLDEAPDAVMIELVERNIPNLLLSAPLMPALKKDAPPGAIETAASFDTRKRLGFTQIFGCFEGEGVDPAARILVNVGADYYEAFPILEEDAKEMSEGYSAPLGFCVTLPEGVSGDEDMRIFIDAG